MHIRHAFSLSIAAAALAVAQAAAAHPVNVDGSASEWSTRLPSAANLGIIARNGMGHGEYIWRDALADSRTDISMPEVVADMDRFQITGDPTGIGFLLRRAPGVVLSGDPIQVQIAIDIDRVDGSGQEYFAEFGDTKVASPARWERLVETLFGSGGTGKVIDTNFSQVAMVSAVQGATGNVEIFVPWSALGMNAPPTTPLRFSVATFRAKSSDVTVDIGGPIVSNALDVISNYADPATSMFPNTYQDVQDMVVDHWLDVHFAETGEVYAPVLVQSFLPNPSAGVSDEWYRIVNVSPDTVSLAGFKIGDEETPDGAEGMFSFPPAATIAAGASFTVARAGGAYQTFYGAPPDAEIPPSASMAVPDMTVYPQWCSSAFPTILLGNAGDELVVLDPSNTILDVAVFGTGAYSGILTHSPAPGLDQVLVRNAALADTDNCQVDFSNVGQTCTTDAQCGSPCKSCVNNACENKPMGAACPDADPCNGDEICDGGGMCVTSAAPPCDDGDGCTIDACEPGVGCSHTAAPGGTPCPDGDLCNGDETCDDAGGCMSGMPLDCDDGDPCTDDACDAAMGCSNTDAPEGSPCPDGDLCNGDETCDAAGACVDGPALDCSDGNACTVDSCDPASGCMHVDAADGTDCGDGDGCNGAEVCEEGQCAPGAPLVCDDGDACNGVEVCAAGQCAPGTAPDCNDDNDCTDDSCDAAIGCTWASSREGAECGPAQTCLVYVCDGKGSCEEVGSLCDSTGGTGGTGGATGDGGTTTTTGTGASSIDPGGCGCRTAGDDRSSDLAWLATLAVAAGFARRRRRA